MFYLAVQAMLGCDFLCQQKKQSGIQIVVLELFETLTFFSNVPMDKTQNSINY